MPGRFGAYEVLHELKSGGMGAVLLARRRGPGTFEQLVAIKTIRPDHAGTAAVRAMFLDEAAILARLAHPGVAIVHDFGEDGGTLYMVMEYVAGIAFRDLVERRPPPAICARMVAEACRGLHAAHEVRDLSGQPMGLVHRDISPDNLMLGFDGHVKVIDFGIALVKNRQAPVTEFGMVKGKPPYMSPEQVKNEAISRKSDVFSLGIVLWELLTGEALFHGDSIYAVALAVESGDIRPPSQVIGEALPRGLDAAVLGALDRELATRTPTAAAFAEQLEQVVQAAGGETLEAWAERELRSARDEHRAWLAAVVARETGGELPKLVGRASGAVTELGAEVAGAMPRSRDVSGLDVAPQRRRIAPAVAILLLALALGGGAIYVTTRSSTPSVVHDAATRIVAIDARPAIDAGMITMLEDASPPPPVPVLDAGRRVTHHADAAVHGAASPPVDAAPSPPAIPAGTGYLVAKHRPDGSYLNVIVDGHQIGTTPMLGHSRPLSSGPHTIELVAPDTGAVVVHEAITVLPDRTYEVAPH